MPKPSAAQSLEATISAVIDSIVVRTLASIERAIASQVAAELQRSANPARRAGRAAPTAKRRHRRARTAELTKWVADRRARRVPTFVIEATGLDTKKKIVAKFGENAAFEKGKPLPATLSQLPKGDAEKSPAKATSPVVRKAAAK